MLQDSWSISNIERDFKQPYKTCFRSFKRNEKVSTHTYQTLKGFYKLLSFFLTSSHTGNGLTADI